MLFLQAVFISYTLRFHVLFAYKKLFVEKRAQGVYNEFVFMIGAECVRLQIVIL